VLPKVVAVKIVLPRLLLLCYALGLGGIIYLANHGGGRFWTFITDIPGGDKLGHIGLVGTLSLLLNIVLRGRRAPGSFSGIMLGSLIVATVMTLEEFSQAAFPSRSRDLLDGIANLVGAAAGECLARFFLRPKSQSATA
jgi:polysaccharide biosynthesis protein VpsQ